MTKKKKKKNFPKPMYLDCCGSTPVEPAILERFATHVQQFPGNSSAQHRYGYEARKRIQEAKEVLAQIHDGSADSVIFTSGATESNNLAILGLRHLFTGQTQTASQAQKWQKTGQNSRGHIICSAIEHSSVIEPVRSLLSCGLRVSWVKPESTGQLSTAKILSELQPDTVLICLMQVSNETGVVQPVAELAQALEDLDHNALLHCDAAQGAAHLLPLPPASTAFSEYMSQDLRQLAKIADLRHPRIDMISISGHKMHGLCGIGALLLRQRRKLRCKAGSSGWPPLQGLFCGGAQQGIPTAKDLRSGSIPTALALSLADAWEYGVSEQQTRYRATTQFREHLLLVLQQLGAKQNAATELCLPHICSVTLPGIDAESAVLNLRSIAAVSRGAACSSQKDSNPVLAAMGHSKKRQSQSLRLSWSHLSWQNFQTEMLQKQAGKTGIERNELWQDWGNHFVRKLESLRTC